jgi:hypothetical protein
MAGKLVLGVGKVDPSTEMLECPEDTMVSFQRVRDSRAQGETTVPYKVLV